MPIKVKALAKNKAEVLIYEAIGENWYGDGLTAKRIDEELKALGDVKDIKVRINSPGGAVFDGIAIYNILKNHAATVHVIIDGLAASAASIIAMAGDKISMGQATQMMIHNPWTIAWGDSDEMKKVATMLDSIRDGMVDAYIKRTGLARDEVVSMLDAETWMSPAVAIDKGFADELLEAEPTPTEDPQEADNSSPRWAAVMSSFRNVPSSLKPRLPAGISLSAKAVATPEEKTMPKEATASVTNTDNDIDTAKAEAKAEANRTEKKRRNDVKSVFVGALATAHAALLSECLDDMDCTPDNASKKLLAKLGEGSEPLRPANVTNIVDERDKFNTGASRALLARMGHEKPEVGNNFNGQSLADLAATSLRLAGVSVAGMSKDGIARKVLAYHTTSDFPNLLSSTAGKVLRKAFDLRPGTWRSWAAVGQVSDFKIHPRIQLGSFSSLATIVEGGEYTYGTIGEQYENAQASTKGKAISFTRQMLVNDDLGGFNRRAMLMGDAAARTINEDAYASLLSASGLGPTSSDTGTLINATAVTTAGGHANYTASGTAITVTSMGVGRVSMASKKAGNLGTGATLNLVPAVLLTSINKEDIARTFMASETDPSSSNSKVPNIYKNRYEVVADPLIDAATYTNSWYLFADPNGPAAAMEVVFLDGNEAPFIDDEVDFDTDALKFKVRLDYGIAIGDWRGVYRNLGA